MERCTCSENNSVRSEDIMKRVHVHPVIVVVVPWLVRGYRLEPLCTRVKKSQFSEELNIASLHGDAIFKYLKQTAKHQQVYRFLVEIVVV